MNKSGSERAGRKIFEHAGCSPCHSGPDFTDSADNVLHDVGTILPTSGMRLGAKLAGIDTPTLKGLWQSAPYLHDGRAATLNELFTNYTKDDMGVTSNLSKTELDQLVRYLLELDDVPETVVPDDPAPTAESQSSCSITRSHSTSNGRPAAIWLLVSVLAAARTQRRRTASRALHDQ